MIPKQRRLCPAFAGSLGYPDTQFASNAGEAKRKLGDGVFSLLIINTPLSDDFGRELALTAEEKFHVSVIMLVGNGQADRVATSVEKYGVFVLSKPLSRSLMAQAMKFIRVSQYRIQSLEKRNRQLTRKLEASNSSIGPNAH